MQGGALLNVRICADLAHQRSTVALTGYDASARDTIDEQVGGEVVTAEITGGRTGPEVVERALGKAASFRVREVALTAKQAQASETGRHMVTARAEASVPAATRALLGIGADERVLLIAHLRTASGGASGDGGAEHASRAGHARVTG